MIIHPEYDTVDADWLAINGTWVVSGASGSSLSATGASTTVRLVKMVTAAVGTTVAHVGSVGSANSVTGAPLCWSGVRFWTVHSVSGASPAALVAAVPVNSGVVVVGSGASSGATTGTARAAEGAAGSMTTGDLSLKARMSSHVVTSTAVGTISTILLSRGVISSRASSGSLSAATGAA